MRIWGLLFAAAVVAAFKLPSTQAKGQPEEAATEPRWEYKVLTTDARGCSADNAVNNLLNDNGRKGWELVSFQQTPASPPTEAHGTILFRPASTGYGKEVQPNLTDSFQGNIDFRMPPGQSPCRFVFSRQIHGATKP